MLLGRKKPTKFATWNVRSLYQVGKTAVVAQEMENYGLDLLGIAVRPLPALLRKLDTIEE